MCAIKSPYCAHFVLIKRLTDDLSGVCWKENTTMGSGKIMKDHDQTYCMNIIRTVVETPCTWYSSVNWLRRCHSRWPGLKHTVDHCLAAGASCLVGVRLLRSHNASAQADRTSQMRVQEDDSPHLRMPNHNLLYMQVNCNWYYGCTLLGQKKGLF